MRKLLAVGCAFLTSVQAAATSAFISSSVSLGSRHIVQRSICTLNTGSARPKRRSPCLEMSAAATIRAGRKGDAADLLTMIKELAEFEKELDQVERESVCVCVCARA